MNPVGKVPVLVDTDADNLRLLNQGLWSVPARSLRPGLLQPDPGTPEHALYLQWSWFAEATFARPLGGNRESPTRVSWRACKRSCPGGNA
ncbi:MAG: hypothetical protein CM15mP120_00200 [Pseudomonadota bacterium]|nr:MAG: hypothetical protein CM15mP120_00200 [Pseudomonadota bacterium]